MNTNNCLYCEKVFENMKGKLLIDVKIPDNSVILQHIAISEINGLFTVTLAAGSTFIYDIKDKMKLCAHGVTNKKNSEIVEVSPDEFNHLIVDYDYFYYQNQPRVERIRLSKVTHKTSGDLYNM